jgi:hypothetical protein
LNGVVCGGNLTIPETMGSNYGLLIQNFKDIFGEKRLNVFIKLLHALEKSFINVYIKILDNKNISEIERNEILTKCADNNLIYNIREERYEQYEPTDNNRGFHKTNIINSCETDIEILKTVMSILGLVATSNQFVIYPLRK